MLHKADNIVKLNLFCGLRYSIKAVGDFFSSVFERLL